MRAIGFFLFMTLIALPVLAETPQPSSCKKGPLKFSAFENHSRIEPIIADPREVQTHMMAFDYSKPFEYSVRRRNHKIWDIKLGTDFPGFALDHGEEDGKIGKGCFGLQAGFTLDLQVVEDLTDNGSPIADAEYVFGPVGRVTYGISDRDWLGIIVRVHHRSAHVGDEFLLNGQDKYGPTFQRIDINYQFLQIGGVWDRKTKFGMLTERLSMLLVIDDHGFYTTNVRSRGKILPSVRNHEPAYAIQLMPTGNHGWRPYASFNLSLDTILNYTKQIPNQKESSQFSESLVLGLRHLTGSKPQTPDLVVRIYYGLNPYGQFRKQNNYTQLAVGLHFPF